MPVIQGHDIDADLAVGLSEMSHHSAVHTAVSAQINRNRARHGLPPIWFNTSGRTMPTEKRSWALPVIYLALVAVWIVATALWVIL